MAMEGRVYSKFGGGGISNSYFVEHEEMLKIEAIRSEDQSNNSPLTILSIVLLYVIYQIVRNIAFWFF